jgi:two-component system chemotaxis response regulator CheY
MDNLIGKSKRPSILIADEDSSMRKVLKEILARENYPIAGEVSDGLQAVMSCVELKPDIIFIDLHVPKMNGIKALEEIRKARPETIVLMLGSDATIDTVKEALSKGASGFIVKPLRPASILDKLNFCWKQKKNNPI